MMDSANSQGIEKLQASMPSLEELDASLRSRRSLGNLLNATILPTPVGQHLVNAFVHVVGKSLIEYQELRAALLSYLARGFAEDFHRAQDRGESCVNALHRALILLDRLRNQGFCLADGQPYVPRARELAILRDANRNGFRVLRDAQEHIDKDIFEGRVPAGSEVVVRPMWDKLKLLDGELPYVQIAENIRQLHKFAKDLSTMTITVSEVSGLPDVNATSDG